jgi:hypothetical protein
MYEEDVNNWHEIALIDLDAPSLSTRLCKSFIRLLPCSI